MTKNKNMIQTTLIPEPKPLSIENLVIEVGRNCNLNCIHCLRGDANTSGMTNEIVDKIFENISYVQSLTITGGEPFLYPETMLYIANTIEKKKIDLGSFFIATNGTVKSEKTILAIIKLYSLSDEKECCSIRISNDEFHKNERQFNNLHLDETLDLLSITYKDEIKYTKDNTINQGNASDNCEALRNPDDEGMIIHEDEETGEIRAECLIYVNTKGDILTGCDYSYENQESISHGNILEESLYNIIYAAK